MTFKKFNRLGMFTDIHFGARGNNEQHLQDCLAYIDWFCELVVKEKCDAIGFLGDWYENRNAINVRTFDASQEAARRLNTLGIPVFFIVGNHDLYFRSSRKIFSTTHFADLENFVVVNEPMEITDEVFMSPFLFKDEYPELADKLNSYKYVLGHFEFRNFVVSGSDRKLDHGPDASQFTGPKYMISGHFHKRQLSKNIVYIGNTFPTNFGDAGDSERGAAVLDVNTEDLYFVNYDAAPMFYKTRLSQVLNGDFDFKPGSRVRCLLDIDVGYTDVQAVREEMITALDLREFTVEQDTLANQEALENGKSFEEEEGSSLDDTVRALIGEGVAATANIDPTVLISIYESLRVE